MKTSNQFIKFLSFFIQMPSHGFIFSHQLNDGFLSANKIQLIFIKLHFLSSLKVCYQEHLKIQKIALLIALVLFRLYQVFMPFRYLFRTNLCFL